jgi:hypothetical protein
MASLKWCMVQKKGIKLIEPNDNLCAEYIQTAEETLDVLRDIKSKSKVWLATTKYYCEYFAAYSLLMKIGIKCEIHDCTIAVCSFLEAKKILPFGFSEILEKDKQLRIDNQYYLKNREVQVNYNELLNFVLKMKDICSKLSKEDIKKIREAIAKCK